MKVFPMQRLALCKAMIFLKLSIILIGAALFLFIEQPNFFVAS